MKQFKVASGKIKECVQDEKGRWVTPNKGWLVAHEDGTPIDGCEVYVEPLIEDAVLINAVEKPADYASTTKDMIKAYLVCMDVPFNASASKLTLWDLIPV